MQSFAWLRNLGRALEPMRQQRHLSGTRGAEWRKFLVPLRFEALEQRVLLAADFGDAPAPYPTLLTENGAQHTPAGPTLGLNRDAQANGTHSATATADDTTGAPDDEDGVTFGTIRVGALGATATVEVRGIATTARLDAWLCRQWLRVRSIARWNCQLGR